MSVAAALEVAAAGLRVFPCRKSKRPVICDWPTFATTDRATIERWWRANPAAMVGLVTGGADGVFIIDVDTDKETGERVGESTLAALGLGYLLEGPRVATPSAGWHIYFRAPADCPRNSAGKLGPHVDCRGSGGFIIAPGSTNGAGCYTASEGFSWGALPAVPAEVLDAPRPKPRAAPAPHVPSGPPPEAWAAAALHGELAVVRSAAPGTRNHALNKAAYALGQIVGGGGLNEADVRATLLEAALATGLDPVEAETTIGSGVAAGMAAPRTAAPKSRAALPKRTGGYAMRDDPAEASSDIYVGRVEMADRSTAVDEVCRRLGGRRLAFNYAGAVALVKTHPSAVYRDPDDDELPATFLMAVSAIPDALMRHVEAVSKWEMWDERAKKLREKPAPDWVAKRIVAERGETLPALLGVASHPVFHKGKLLAGNIGFHAPTNLYIRCGAVRAHRWKDACEAARFLADDWLGRFPFREEGDLERALLLPLTLLTRRTMIRGGAPLFFITSPEARSGKSLLGRCLVLAVEGALPATIPFKSKAEEFAKVFDAAALEGQGVMFFNNARNGWTIGTAEIDAYVDSDEYSPRLFGSLTKRTVPALAIPVFCGNNIEPAGDTATRTIEVRLERQVNEAGLVAALDSTRENRDKILSALVAVLRHEAPETAATSRFPQWERIVARPLMDLRGAGDTTIAKLSEAVSGAAADLDFEDFVLRLAEMADERERIDGASARWMTASELIGDGKCNAALEQLLAQKGAPAPTLRPNNLPKQLAPFKDQAAGGFRLRIEEKIANIGQKRPFKHFTAEPTC